VRDGPSIAGGRAMVYLLIRLALRFADDNKKATPLRYHLLQALAWVESGARRSVVPTGR